jgi:hypothetical protein
MVLTARLESCGALGNSSSVPIGSTVILGRDDRAGAKTKSKLDLGIVHTDDGVSRRQAELQVRPDCTAALRVTEKALNPVRVVREGGGELLATAGHMLELKAGDMIELDTYRRSNCKFMVQACSCCSTWSRPNAKSFACVLLLMCLFCRPLQTCAARCASTQCARTSAELTICKQARRSHR